MNAIETRELTKHYQRGQIKALTEVSLNVERGKVFSLLGPNGAGKTTLIKLLLGIVFPTGGNATLLGEDISNAQIHERLGYLAENHRFPDFLTANQVLYYFGKMAGVSPNNLKSRIPVLLKRVNLQDWGDTRIRKYSKGMMQRVGIAQALMNEPDLLFLDEPTDGIDPVGRREIRELLNSLRNEGKTIFLNSHLLSEVERISDEVAILKKGQLVRQGSVDELISVKQQYEVQLGGEDLALKILCKELHVPVQDIKGKTVISVEDDAQLNHIIDMLREQQLVIQGIIPRKISLEDFFIDIIEDKPRQEEVSV
ncbi:MAG: ABC transporter ATP-binding protein [Calditrichia bacterium]